MDNIIAKTEKLLFTNINEKVKLSYICLLTEYASLYRLTELPKFFPREVFKDFLSYLEKDIIGLKEAINSNTDDRLDAAKQYVEWKKKISEMYLQMNLYENQLALNEFICINYQSQAKSSSSYIGKHARSEIIEKCAKYIDEFTGRDLEDRISKLMSAIPIRMAREKYYDYIRTSLKNQCNTHSNLTHLFIENFKRKFYPTAYPGYGDVFSGVAEALANIMSEEMPDMDAGLSDKIIYDTIEDIYESFDEMSNIIDDIFLLLDIMFECCSYMQILLLYMPNWDEFFANDLSLADLYYSIRENANSELKDDFLERVSDFTDQNTNFEHLKKMDKDMFSTMKINEDIFDNMHDDTLRNMFTTYATITDLFVSDMKMHSYNFIADILDESTSLSSAEVESAVEEMVNYVKGVYSGLSPKYAKIIRQFSFGTLTIDEPVDKTINYVKSCLQSEDPKYINYFDLMIEHLLFSDRFYWDKYDIDKEYIDGDDDDHHIHHDGCCDHDHHVHHDGCCDHDHH